jgi:hypothetical protein
MSNRAIEDVAIAYVLNWEAAHGRPSHDTRGTGAAGDVAGVHRTIEVKAYGGFARGEDLWLEPRQVSEGRQNPNFWLYVVENIRQGDPARFRCCRSEARRFRRCPTAQSNAGTSPSLPRGNLRPTRPRSA